MARPLGVTRVRVTQFLDLTLFVPDIQEQILFAESVDRVEPITERAVRGEARERSWTAQRATWQKKKA